MAVASDSTTAPAPRYGLLRPAAELPRPPLLPVPAPLPSLTHALSRRAALFGPVDLDQAPPTPRVVRPPLRDLLELAADPIAAPRPAAIPALVRALAELVERAP